MTQSLCPVTCFNNAGPRSRFIRMRLIYHTASRPGVSYWYNAVPFQICNPCSKRHRCEPRSIFSTNHQKMPQTPRKCISGRQKEQNPLFVFISQQDRVSYRITQHQRKSVSLASRYETNTRYPSAAIGPPLPANPHRPVCSDIRSGLALSDHGTAEIFARPRSLCVLRPSR
jgi:hypothetical protein